MELIITIYLCAVATLLVFGFRNEAVFKFRDKLREKVYESTDWQEKRLIYHQHSYDEMVWKFWRPLTEKEWYGNLLD